MAEINIRHRQQTLVGELAHLLTNDLPTAYWVVHHTASGGIEGLLSSQDDLRAWATALAVEIKVERFQDGTGTLYAEVAPGIRVWFPLKKRDLAKYDAEHPGTEPEVDGG